MLVPPAVQRRGFFLGEKFFTLCFECPELMTLRKEASLQGRNFIMENFRIDVYFFINLCLAPIFDGEPGEPYEFCFAPSLTMNPMNSLNPLLSGSVSRTFTTKKPTSYEVSFFIWYALRDSNPRPTD